MSIDNFFRVKNQVNGVPYLGSAVAMTGNSIDLSQGSYFTKTLSSDTTLSFTNVPSNSFGSESSVSSFYLELTGASSGTPSPYSDISFWSIDSGESVTTTQEQFGLSVNFKSDGTKMFISGTALDRLFEYSLSTAWDLSTVSYSNKNFALTGAFPLGGSFKPDGTEFYYVNNSTDQIYQVSLSTAWDVSSASATTSISGPDNTPYHVAFKPDGTKMFVSGISADYIWEYSLSTAWDLSTATSNTSTDRFYTRDIDGNLKGFVFDDDGDRIWAVGTDNHNIYQLDLSTAYDITTASFTTGNILDISSLGFGGAAITLKTDGTKAYVTENATSGQTDVYQISTTTETPSTVTWPSSVKWHENITPSTPPIGQTVGYVFLTTDGGSTWYARQAGDNIS